MQTFVQIADQGSLTRAADALGSSLPAVVRALAALETHLGVRLFHRTTRRISLTEEGRQLPAQRARGAGRRRRRRPRAHARRGRARGPSHGHGAGAVRPHVRGAGHRALLAAPRRDALQRAAARSPGEPAGGRRRRRHPHQRAGRLVAGRPAARQHPPRGGREPGLAARASAGPRIRASLARANCVCAAELVPGNWMFRENGRPLAVAVKGNIEFNHIAPAIETCAAGLGSGLFLSYQVLPWWPRAGSRSCSRAPRRRRAR